MTKTNYLDVRVGVYLYGKSKKTGRNYYRLEPKVSKSLREVLSSQDYRYLVETYRKCHKSEVKQKIGSFTPSGYYEETRDKTVQPIPATGLVQVDIDGKTNVSITDWIGYRDYIFKSYPFIAVAAISCGGKGLYLLINTTGWQNYERHYYAAVELFTDKEGLEIDASVSSPNEIRYLSLPEEVLFREDATIFKEFKDKPRSSFEGIPLDGDGELVQVPAELKGKMRRAQIVDLISRALHNGTAIDKVKAYLTMIASSHLDPTSHLHGDYEETCRLCDDLYHRYADQFNQVLQAGKRARLSSRSKPVGSKPTLVHPSLQERDKRLEEHEKLSIASDWVSSRVVYDIIGDRYLLDDQSETSPAREYAVYNERSDSLTFIEKHFFMNAFETGEIPRINPIKDWSAALPPWDGKDWIRALSKFVPAKDPAQCELFLKAWMTRAFIQSVNPENLNPVSIVNRWLLILHQHKENSGKSSFLQWIAPNIDWVKLSGLEENKDGYAALAKYMFVLDEELAGLGSFKFHTRFKALISTAKIDVRPPYAKADIKMDRSASFYGSTNNDKIFPATEGNSRFLVIQLKDEDFDWRTYTKQIDKDQLWSQVRTIAATEYLSKIGEDISYTQSKVNADLVRDNEEIYLVDTYLEADTTGGILQTEAISEHIKLMNSGYSRINLNTLGQALRKKFGERVNGYVAGVRRMGYPVRFKAVGGTPPVIQEPREGRVTLKGSRFYESSRSKLG